MVAPLAKESQEFAEVATFIASVQMLESIQIMAKVAWASKQDVADSVESVAKVLEDAAGLVRNDPEFLQVWLEEEIDRGFESGELRYRETP